MQTTYTKTFKIEAVKKVLSRTSHTTFKDIAKSLDLPRSTLYGWIQAMKDRDLAQPLTGERFSEKKSCQWTSQERFDAVIDTARLSQEQISEYCRKKGIFPHHLEVWKKDFIENSSSKKAPERTKEIKVLKEENKKLNKELHRKEKALAEAAALLMLKKKAEDYWDLKEEG
jgi:transposase-like protein